MTPDLGRDLESLAAMLDLPDEPRVIPGEILSGLAAEPSPRRRLARRRVATALALVLGVTAVPVAPAVADWLGIGGIRVEGVPSRPETTEVEPTAIAGDGALGKRVSAAEAERSFGSPLARPASLGEPDGYWVDGRSGALIVSLDYGSLIVSQFQLPLARDVVQMKLAGPDVRIEPVDVDGARGLWIEGAHAIALVEPDGDTVVESTRLSANALVWERDGITFRIETRAGKQEAVDVASSIR